MGRLKKAENTMAFLKAGIYGGTGSGKSFTASKIAIGLHKMIKSKKPIAFFDTETGSNYLIPMFEKAGIEMLQDKARTLSALCTTIDEAIGMCDILIIDSITHVWREFTLAYQTKHKRSFIQLWDWKPIKDEWYTSYTSRYVNSKIHIIMCGREGSIYEDQDDAQNKGKKKSVKVGTKMSAETETGYEPGLLLEMSKNYTDPDGEGGIYYRNCHVIKDRFDLIDSQEFDNPTFDNFKPHIQALNLGGNQFGVDVNETSEDMIDKNGDGVYYRMQKKKTICLEEITEEIKKYFPGSSSQEKSIRGDIMEYVFCTRSWTKVENSDILLLETGLKILRGLLPQYNGEKTFKDFIVKADTNTPKEEESAPDGQILCPNAEKYVDSKECEGCKSRKGCPEHAEDIS
jgi:hypothetical protein